MGSGIYLISPRASHPTGAGSLAPLLQDILFHVWLVMKKISSDNISDAIVLTRARHTLEKTPKKKRIRPTFENGPYIKTRKK